MPSTDKKPLAGKKVLVTRAAHQAGEFSRILRGMGATPVEHPVIEIRPLSSPSLRSFVRKFLSGEDRYDYVIFTSRNGVDAFFRLAEKKKGAEVLRKASVVAIGPKTAKALEKIKITPHLVPDKYIAEQVAGALLDKGVKGRKILLLRAREARQVLPRRLRAAGALVTVRSLYETRTANGDPEALKKAVKEADFITFTSSSTVKNLLKIVFGDKVKTGKTGLLPGGARLASIGPITSKTAIKLGLGIDIEASEYTVKGLAQAIADYVRSG